MSQIGRKMAYFGGFGAFRSIILVEFFEFRIERVHPQGNGLESRLFRSSNYVEMQQLIQL